MSQEKMLVIPQLLKKKAESKGWSINRIATEVGVSWKTAKSWADGEFGPKLEHVAKLKKVLGVSYEEMIEGPATGGPSEGVLEPLTLPEILRESDLPDALKGALEGLGNSFQDAIIKIIDLLDDKSINKKVSLVTSPYESNRAQYEEDEERIIKIFRSLPVEKKIEGEEFLEFLSRRYGTGQDEEIGK